jgi:hypothetical protein
MRSSGRRGTGQLSIHFTSGRSSVLRDDGPTKGNPGDRE